MRNAIDCATKLNATSAAALVKQGVSHVGRYLGHSWKGLEKAEAAHLLEERVDLLVALVAGDKDKTPGEGGLGALDGDVKHIARQIGHEHVAEDDIEIRGHHLT